MTPQLYQVSHWMTAQHRTVRFSPTTKIPPIERADAVQYIAQALRAFKQATCVTASDTFATATTEATLKPEEVFTALTLIHAQVLAAYHTYGFPAAEASGIHELTREAVPQGAGPTKVRDFKMALETFYPTTKP